MQKLISLIFFLILSGCSYEKTRCESYSIQFKTEHSSPRAHKIHLQFIDSLKSLGVKVDNTSKCKLIVDSFQFQFDEPFSTVYRSELGLSTSSLKGQMMLDENGKKENFTLSTDVSSVDNEYLTEKSNSIKTLIQNLSYQAYAYLIP